MKKLLFIAVAAMVCVSPVSAQFTTVNYDFERNWFNEGQSLPAEKPMIFKGNFPEETKMAELHILSSKQEDDLYIAVWHQYADHEFTITVPYRLRASDKYDFRFNLFRASTVAERNKTAEELTTTLSTYIEVNLTGEKQIKLLKNSKKTYKDLNEIIRNSLGQYRNSTMDWHPMLSEIVRLKLEQLEKTDLNSGYTKGDTTTTKKAVRADKRSSVVNSLQERIKTEVEQMLADELLVMSATRFVDDYATEAKENTLSVNAGYGGVYLSGDLDGLTYGAAPYLGLAFPLGNSVLGSKFLSNTSVTLGVFLENFEDDKGNEVTGLLIGRPFYAGLDHKLFKFVRVNAGASFLESTVANTPPDTGTSKNIMVRPYIGLSARIDFSVGLGK